MKRRPRKKAKFGQYLRHVILGLLMVSLVMLFLWPHLRSALLKAFVPVGRGYLGTLENKISGTALISGGGFIVTAPAGGTLKLQVNQSDSVKVGQVLATIGHNATGDEFNRSIDLARASLADYESRTQDEFELLMAKAQEDYVSAVDSLFSAQDAWVSRDSKSALQDEASFVSYAQAVAGTRKRIGQIEDKRAELSRNIDLLVAALDASRVNVISPAAGVFFPSFSEIEVRLSGMSLDDLDASEIMVLSQQAKNASQVTVADGDSVETGQPIGKVLSGRELSFCLPLKTEDRPFFEQNQKVILRFSDDTEVQSRIGKVVDAKPPGYSVVYGSIESLPVEKGAGSYDITIVTGGKTGIIVPQKSIFELDGQLGVLLLRKTYAVFKPVEVLLTQGKQSVVKGIAETDELVLKPKGFLEGRRVR